MSIFTLLALIVIPAGIALFVWLWLATGRDYHEVRTDAERQAWLENRDGYHLPPKGPWMQPTRLEMDDYHAAARRRVQQAMEEES